MDENLPFWKRLRRTDFVRYLLLAASCSFAAVWSLHDAPLLSALLVILTMVWARITRREWNIARDAESASRGRTRTYRNISHY